MKDEMEPREKHNYYNTMYTANENLLYERPLPEVPGKTMVLYVHLLLVPGKTMVLYVYTSR